MTNLTEEQLAEAKKILSKRQSQHCEYILDYLSENCKSNGEQLDVIYKIQLFLNNQLATHLK